MADCASYLIDLYSVSVTSLAAQVNVCGRKNDYTLYEVTGGGVDTVGSEVRIPTRLSVSWENSLFKTLRLRCSNTLHCAINSRPRCIHESLKGTNIMIKTRATLLLVALSIVAAAVIAAHAQSRKPPVYEVSRTATPVKVDGKLDDAVWTKAAPFPNLRLNLDGSPSSTKTEAKALYDDNFLYVSFRCADNNIWATLKKRDQHLWNEEVVEVFVQADPQQSSYIELDSTYASHCITKVGIVKSSSGRHRCSEQWTGKTGTRSGPARSRCQWRIL